MEKVNSLMAQAQNDPKNAGKPENIIEKMITGRLNKELKEVCLLEQEYVKAEDKQTVKRARRVQRFMSQPFHVAESFTGQSGIYVPLEKTIDSVERILSGELDMVPEQYFLMTGTADDVLDAYKKENG